MSFLTDVVEAIRAHRAELETLLDPPARAELLEILADAESDPVVAAADLRELIKPFTPPGHPLRAALTPPECASSPVRQCPRTATHCWRCSCTCARRWRSRKPGRRAPGRAPAGPREPCRR